MRISDWSSDVCSSDLVRQITNAYRFCLPPAARRMVERIVGKGPAPDDDTHRREAAAQEMEAMLASLPADQRMHAMNEDDALAGVLARLGLAIETNASSPRNKERTRVVWGKKRE